MITSFTESFVGEGLCSCPVFWLRLILGLPVGARVDEFLMDYDAWL